MYRMDRRPSRCKKVQSNLEISGHGLRNMVKVAVLYSDIGDTWMAAHLHVR